MAKQKNIRLRGKINLTNYFQEFKKGDKVAIVEDRTFAKSFPPRIQGRTGTIEGSKGAAYLVKLITGNQETTHIIRPIHLKKIMQK